MEVTQVSGGNICRDIERWNDVWGGQISMDIVFFLMIRRPPRSTLSSSSAASDVYKRQKYHDRHANLSLTDHQQFFE